MPASFRGVQTHVRAQRDTAHAITSNVQRVSTILTTDFMAGPFWALGVDSDHTGRQDVDTEGGNQLGTRARGGMVCSCGRTRAAAVASPGGLSRVPAPRLVLRGVVLAAQQQQQGARDSQRGVREGVPHCTRPARAGIGTQLPPSHCQGQGDVVAAALRLWAQRRSEYISKEPGHGDGITLLHRELQSLATATSERPSVSWFV